MNGSRARRSPRRSPIPTAPSLMPLQRNSSEKALCGRLKKRGLFNKPACAGGTSTKRWKGPACLTIQTGLFRNKPACAGGTSTKGWKSPACATIQTELFRNKPACAGGTSTKGWKSPACATIQTGLFRNKHNPLVLHMRVVRLSINPVGGVGGSQPSDCQSGLSDMCGEVGSLAQQGFLAGFHGRTKGAVKTCFVGKDRQRRAFSTR